MSTKITFLEESEALTPQSLANSTLLLVSKVVNTTPPVQKEGAMFKTEFSTYRLNKMKYLHFHELNKQLFSLCTVCGERFGQNVKCVAPKNVMLEASQWFTFQYFTGTKFV